MMGRLIEYILSQKPITGCHMALPRAHDFLNARAHF